MQTIITPTNFSDVSLHAVNYAADMAKALNAGLLVLHATESYFNCSEVYSEPKHDEIEIENKLSKLRNDLIKRTANKISVRSKQVFGLIENEIIKMCNYQNPLAVVMATQGASFKNHLFIESITVYLSKNLEYPVIVVPGKVDYKPINKILLATDLENLYDLPVEKIINIVTAFNAQVDIIHVYNNESEFEFTSRHMIELNGYLQNIHPNFYFIKSKNVYEAITGFAKKNNSDLILAFPKKHSFFHRSKSKQFIFNAPFAVMTIQ